jgi:hypothetical protein
MDSAFTSSAPVSVRKERRRSNLRQPEWERDLEAAQLVGAELERAMNEAEKKLQDEANASLSDGLTPIQAKGSGVEISQVG